MRMLDYVGVKHLVVGATILGVGGGGSPEDGLRVLMDDLNAGHKLLICNFDELDPDLYIATPYYAGSIPAPGSKPKKSKKFTAEVMIKALRLLEGVIENRIAAVIATEIGGGNTATALHLAALLGLPLVDGDHAGRSVPELVHSTYIINGVPLTPSVVTTADGDYLVFKEYSSIECYEDIVRAIAAQAGGTVFVLDSPVKVQVASKVAVNGSVSKAIEIGEAVEKARNEGLNVASIVAEKLDGYVIFKGEIERHDLKEKAGFLIGNTYIKGKSGFDGNIFRIWVKNENIMAWIDGEPIVMPPDLIIVIGEDGYGVVNSKLKVGMEVTVVAAPGPNEWKTPKGLEVVGPRHFGFNYDYIPVERLVEKVLR
ncbi:MAG: DUF917 domain-containing protein [Candidatus Methanomethylicota archaeon]|uniref:DUF917 domain-containing protein n=1 Tax=Thermoproteota archaeon TaxID=2056631 RepID=A0A497F640_9CREN|nr:MAG: DUF917 domain-containing protein [Candidatus Verstraetearchaeota archaeon]